MASTVRVLPALIALSIGALAFKGVDLAQAFAEAVEDEPSTAEEANPETALTAGVGEEGTTELAEGEAPPADACLPSLDYASETGISEQEILVLRSLADRRNTLDAREAGIVTREQMAAAAEARLGEQIAELKTLEGEVTRLLAAVDSKRSEQMDKLIKTYEAMKPKDAGAIFNAMDDKVLLDLSKSMKPATLAAIMSTMDTRRAEALTRMLAALSEPPKGLAMPPAAASGAAPPVATPG